MQTTDIGSAKYGMTRSQALGSDVHAAANGAVTTANQTGQNIDNPMLWLVGIGAVTLGLVAFSTHVRIGKFSAAVTAG